MSESPYESPYQGGESGVIYAIADNNPEGTWSLEWSSTWGDVATDIPPGFHQVTYNEFKAAQDAQARAQSRVAQQMEYETRLGYSRQRRDLVATGMTYAAAKILVPDPVADYTIDDGWLNA